MPAQSSDPNTPVSPATNTFQPYSGIFAPVEIAELAEADVVRQEALSSTNKELVEKNVWVLDKAGRLLSLDRQFASPHQTSFIRITFQYKRNKLIRQEELRWKNKGEPTLIRVDSLVWKLGLVREIHRLDEPGTKTTYEYDDRDNFLCIRLFVKGDAVHREQWFTYTKDGQLLQDSTVMADRGELVWTYFYDENGHVTRLLSVSKLPGRISTGNDQRYFYDANGNMVKVKILDVVRGTVQTLTNRYDSAGRNTYTSIHKQRPADAMPTKFDHDWENWTEYDAEGRLVSSKVVVPQRSASNTEKRYSYSADGLRTDIVYFKGKDNTLDYSEYEIRNEDGFLVENFSKNTDGKEYHYQCQYSKRKKSSLFLPK